MLLHALAVFWQVHQWHRNRETVRALAGVGHRLSCTSASRLNSRMAPQKRPLPLKSPPCRPSASSATQAPSRRPAYLAQVPMAKAGPVHVGGKAELPLKRSFSPRQGAHIGSTTRAPRATARVSPLSIVRQHPAPLSDSAPYSPVPPSWCNTPPHSRQPQLGHLPGLGALMLDPKMHISRHSCAIGQHLSCPHSTRCHVVSAGPEVLLAGTQLAQGPILPAFIQRGTLGTSPHWRRPAITSAAWPAAVAMAAPAGSALGVALASHT